MGKLAGYTIVNLQETFTNSVEVTSYPTEKGLPITDNVKRQPKTFNITGKILAKTNAEATKIYNALEKKQNAGTLVTYVGRTTAKNVVIVNMAPTYDSTISNGMSISIDLQEIRIAKSPYVKKKTTKKKSGKKSTSKTKKTTKVYHVTKKGDCYWKLWKKYGTPVATLRKWNKYPDRYIPVGVKLRVK
ncbi:LysM peptidoglycan-binding domain-containing protein [Heyndrickxia coagulans]|uniref:LysM peptidoglycan-binding domain-containing protein n=1 Tax=Heyndrickxia coagulans TaxID=1398 RepID=UPI0014595EA8|nr:LysM peptidoglycan-binding domain-containing protein [Heyndrickxia coagulans]NMH83266.1 LysM peptidoglycan-binding domain-containing protein [Heyndrickxia coagulans]